jgi:hypothetical protein
MPHVRSNRTMRLMICAMLLVAGTSLAAQKVIKKTEGGGGSPHETVEYMVHGAKITIAYGRPFIKNRPIDAVAPKGQAYRLGADEATVLTTDKTLMIGGLTLEPGGYSLWAWPDATGWKLIVNKQTGQWGTDYDAKQDLGRTDLKTATVSSPQQNFTITVEEKPSNNGALNFDWGQTRLTTGFMVH